MGINLVAEYSLASLLMLHYMFIIRVGLHYGATASQVCHRHGAAASMRSNLISPHVAVTLVQFVAKHTHLKYIHLHFTSAIPPVHQYTHHTPT